MADIPTKKNIPDVYKIERDFSSRISPISALKVASFIESRFGEADYVHTVTSETDLRTIFGEPEDANATSWFLNERPFHYRVQGIGANMQIIRVVGDGSTNGALAVEADGTTALTSTTAVIKNRTEIETFLPTFDGTSILKFHTRYQTDEPFKISVIVDDTGFDFTLETGDYAIEVYDKNDVLLNRHIVSLDPTAVDGFGLSKYIETVLNERDPNIIVFHDTAQTAITANLIQASITVGVYNAPIKADYLLSMAEFENTDLHDIQYILAPEIIHNECITLAETREDCSVRAGIPIAEIVGVSRATALTNVQTYTGTTLNRNTSYMGMGANAVYIDDKYNRKKRWINIAGDLIGLRIQQNLRSQAWYSEAGPNYGILKDVIALAQNWHPQDQKALIEAKTNPVINKRGVGMIVTEQKNYTSKVSALQDQNVRELINYIWRAGKLYLYFKLHEFNDIYTRASIESQFNRFLKNVQDGRGIRRKPDGGDGFIVRCDATNNTEDVVNQNMLILDLSFLPARVITEIYARLNIYDNSVQLELRG